MGSLRRFFTGAAYTAGLGNQSRADLMLATARRKEKDAEILELIEFCVKAFGRLKDIRNSLAHAHSITKAKDEAKPRWVRASKNPRAFHVYCFAEEDDIAVALGATCALAQLLNQLTVFYIGRPARTCRPSIGIFPLPSALTPIQIVPEEPEDPPPPSRA